MTQHIVELRAENVKRLSAVVIRPQDGVTVISGENAAGKTSVLDAIEMAFGGKHAAPPEPIRRGEEKAVIVVELEGLVVERRYWKREDGGIGTRLTVRSDDGAVYSSPQKMLDKLYGALSFDPLAFTMMPPQRQRQTLLDLIGLDFTEHDQKREALYAGRRDLNRTLRDREGQLAKAEHFPDAPAEPVSVDELLSELEKVEAVRSARAEIEGKVRDWAAAGQRVEKSLEEARALVQKLETEAVIARQAHAEAVEALNDLPQPDSTALRERLQGAEQVNRQVEANRRRAEIAAEVARLSARSQDLDEQLEKLDQVKVDAVAAADLPVPGLGVTEDRVTLNGLPFEQASSAEQLRTSFAMAAKAKPELRVALIRDGSLLDANSMAPLAEIAEQHDMQVIVERVGEEPGSIVIEDGAVRDAEEASA